MTDRTEKANPGVEELARPEENLTPEAAEETTGGMNYIDYAPTAQKVDPGLHCTPTKEYRQLPG